MKLPNFSKSVSKVLKRWLYDHIENPYPSQLDKDKLCEKTGLNPKQIQNWFINARKRIWHPIMEDQKGSVGKKKSKKLLKLKLEIASDSESEDGEKNEDSKASLVSYAPSHYDLMDNT